MDHETFAHNEGFPTLSTFIGLLPIVESLMVKKVSTLSEGFPTFSTFIRLLSAMHPLMVNET